ncbi:MAG: hypothetical protein MR598_05010 [Erysipelotrichaceae bacterium]|nr:hypothetical protein [Erysipelotrichaceae bacterium]
MELFEHGSDLRQSNERTDIPLAQVYMNKIKENEALREEKNNLEKKLYVSEKRRNKLKINANILRGIAVAEAVAIIMAVGVPNVQNFFKRREGAKAIVSQLEENHVIPKDFSYIVDELVHNGSGFSYTNYDGETIENWDLSIYTYGKDLVSDAINDGFTKEQMAVAFDKAGFPEDCVEELTGCNKEQIVLEQYKSYYEFKQEQVKNGGISK